MVARTELLGFQTLMSTIPIVQEHGSVPLTADCRMRAPRPPRRFRLYDAGESYWISAKELDRMTQDQSEALALVLYAQDFKWVFGTHLSGLETRVHFGYAQLYGDNDHAPANPLRLRGRWLACTTPGRPALQRIAEGIEIPWDMESCYTYVRAKHECFS